LGEGGARYGWRGRAEKNDAERRGLAFPRGAWERGKPAVETAGFTPLPLHGLRSCGKALLDKPAVAAAREFICWRMGWLWRRTRVELLLPLGSIIWFLPGGIEIDEASKGFGEAGVRFVGDFLFAGNEAFITACEKLLGGGEFVFGGGGIGFGFCLAKKGGAKDGLGAEDGPIVGLLSLKPFERLSGKILGFDEAVVREVIES
jgi:hypothetical protein